MSGTSQRLTSDAIWQGLLYCDIPQIWKFPPLGRFHLALETRVSIEDSGGEGRFSQLVIS